MFYYHIFFYSNIKNYYRPSSILTTILEKNKIPANIYKVVAGDFVILLFF